MAKKKAKEKKVKRTSNVSKNYKVSGDKLERLNLSCPKCGVGVFMAKHGNRSTCGKCNYMEKK